MSEELKEEINAVEADVNEGFVTELSEEELEAVNGGRFTIQVKNLAGTCPYCMKSHNRLQRMGQVLKINGRSFPIYFCPYAREYFICARNGYFDLKGRRL